MKMDGKCCCLVGCLILAGAAVGAADEPQTAIQAGHNLLGETQYHGIGPGHDIGLLAFRTLDGESVYLSDTLEDGPALFVFVSTTCPLAKRYTGRLNRLHDEYAERGLRMFAVFPNADETREGITAFLKTVKFAFPAVPDVGGYLTSRLGATMTPQVFLVDQDAVLRYRGAIDDNRYETRVKESHLKNAVDAVLAGRPVDRPVVHALGCTIYQPSPLADGEVTYTRHVARILQDHCQSCHRPGQVAPFPLTNFAEARRWQAEIKEYTHARLMPPWKAAPGFGEFANDASLSADEIATIAAWVEQGASQGDPAEMPPQPRFHDNWAFGEPDQIVAMPQEYVIGPEGEDDYRHFVIPHESDVHRFVEAIDVRPGNRTVVHHVIAYVDTSGKARELDAQDPGPGYTRFGDVGFQPASMIGGWAPGNLPDKTPPGSGSWLPKKCDIVLQVHYYRSGVEERDLTRVGIYYSKAKRPVRTRLAVAIDQDFVLEAGNQECVVRAATTIREDSYVYSVTPHMHLLGKTMQVTAELPDGTVRPLVKINDWDFNWQITYRCRSLLRLPAGTKVKLIATFDNSAENPNNPHNPPQDVRWGDRTTDEMCIAFLGLLKESEYTAATAASGQNQPGSE